MNKNDKDADEESEKFVLAVEHQKAERLIEERAEEEYHERRAQHESVPVR